MGIPLTQVRPSDPVARWKRQDRSPASITRTRSRRGTTGSARREGAATTFDACGGQTGSCAIGAARGVRRCTACHAETSLTAGTGFQDTRKPLRMWWLAMWFLTSQKNGVSALGLQRVLGLGSDETAWTWRHTLRRAMVRPARERLTGDIEIDETSVGGPEEGTRGRETEQCGHAIGRIRLRRIKDVSAKSLRPFIRETIEPGATIHPDGWSGDAGRADAGDPHRVTVISAGPEPAHEVMPRRRTAQAVAARYAPRWYPVSTSR